MSRSFERFLIERGERVVRVPTRLMASSRRASRQRGKSDRIEALAVARAALAERINTLPTVQLAGRELDLRLLVTTVSASFARAWGSTTRCSGICTICGHEPRLPGSSLFYAAWSNQPARPVWGVRLLRLDA